MPQQLVVMTIFGLIYYSKREIQQNLFSILDLLFAVTEPDEPPDSPPYKNVVKFYSDTGALIYTVLIPYTQVSYSFLILNHFYSS